MKRFWISLLAALLAVMLPVCALALTGASATGGALQTGAADARRAKDYVIRFGLEHKMGNNDTYPIYSAPALNAVRGANGKASMHTSGGGYSAGWSGAWLLMRYEKKDGGYRVGWVPKSELNMRGIEATRSVSFAYWPVTLGKNCMLTDDPLMESEALAYAEAGEKLMYLAFYQYNGGREYAYVQGELDGRPVCGFIPFDAIAW